MAGKYWWNQRERIKRQRQKERRKERWIFKKNKSRKGKNR